VRSSIRIHAPLCAAAILLCSIAGAQWPQRYDHASNTDEGQCVAVDRQGNVYVAGKVKTSSQGYNFLVHSYTAAGVARNGWPQEHNGPGSGDDIPTSISVDASGNVYVGGTSYGGTSRGFDLTVIKYDSTGQTVWTGSGGTGYDFHNGAIRTTSTQNEGAFTTGTAGVAGAVYVSMDLRQSFAAENRLIAVTGVVINNVADWRTVVFEPSGSSVQLKSGWPVDYGDSYEDVPRDVAIHTDNNVYVTGRARQGTHDSRFMVVKFKASGTNQLDTTEWEWNWGDFKDNTGIALVLDSASVYATGEVAGGDTELDYGTARINHTQNDPSNPVAVWETVYDNTALTGNDAPTSIDLTFEIVSGVV
jgi:hypothetical protein